MRDIQEQVAPIQEQDLVAPAIHEDEAETQRFVAGEIPPVLAQDQDPGITASDQAYPNRNLSEEVSGGTENAEELKTKVGMLVDKQFDGDWNKAYAHYAEKVSGKLSHDGIKRLLHDARVGNVFSRKVWTDNMMAMVDTDADHHISWDEFQTVFG